VMTGFRLAAGGAQELFGFASGDDAPDLTTLGKIVGGGLPVGVFGGRAEIMDYLAPLGPVYQAGTLSGNPLAMAAGIATIGYLLEHRDEIYAKLEETTAAIANGVARIAAEDGIGFTTNRVFYAERGDGLCGREWGGYCGVCEVSSRDAGAGCVATAKSV